MHQLLLIESGQENSTTDSLSSAMTAQGNETVRVLLSALEGIDAAATTLGNTFKGQPPTLILLDLSGVSDALLPLRHLQRLLRHVWGEEGGALPVI